MAMAAVNFDALGYSRRLKAAGFNPDQAEEMAVAFKEAIGESEIATKSDLLLLESKLQGEIASVRSELKEEIASVRSELKEEIASVRSELKEEIAGVRNELVGARADITALNANFNAVRWGIAVLVFGVLSVFVQGFLK